MHAIKVGDMICGFTVIASAIKPTGTFLALRCACGNVIGRRLKAVAIGKIFCSCTQGQGKSHSLAPRHGNPVAGDAVAGDPTGEGISPQLRTFKKIVDRSLAKLSPEIASLNFVTPPSIPPARVLKVLLLRKLYSIDSNSIFMEQVASNAQFRWFLDMDLGEETWEQADFVLEQETLMESVAVVKFYRAALERARKARMVPSQRGAADPSFLAEAALP